MGHSTILLTALTSLSLMLGARALAVFDVEKVRLIGSDNNVTVRRGEVQVLSKVGNLPICEDIESFKDRTYCYFLRFLLSQIPDEWLPVCGADIGRTEARTVCHMFGFQNEEYSPIIRPYYYSHLSAPRGDHVSLTTECSGGDNRIDTCHMTATIRSSCDTQQVAVVVCELFRNSAIPQYDDIPEHEVWHYSGTALECEHGPDLRLVGGEFPTEGRLEMYRSNEWGGVCDDTSEHDNAVAETVCRILGLSIDGAVVLTWGHFPKGPGPFHVGSLKCNERESSLDDCETAKPECDYRGEVGIRCGPGIRLANGINLAEGRLEIYRNNEWGSVCGNIFNAAAIEVVCRILRFPFHMAERLPAAHFGEGIGPIILADVICTGEETSLDYCQSNVNPTCSHDTDVSIRCGPLLRLARGSIPAQGLLEVFISDQWGVVCYKGFDDNDAKVVCRTLGYSSSYARAMHMSSLGERHGPILLDDMACIGDESSLFDCLASTIHKCETFYANAGVECGPGIRLVNGANLAEGRLEIFRSDEWGSVCDIGFDEAAAQVACRELRLGVDGAEVLPVAHFGEGIGSIHLDGVVCTGEESRLGDCQGNTEHTCGHNNDVSLRCGPAVRLVDGEAANEGRLEVLRSGEWGTVCDISFDNYDAKVVCRILGFVTDKAVELRKSYFEKGTGPIHMVSVNCKGDELSLDACQPDVSDGMIKYCDHDDDVNVRCGADIRLADGKSPNEGRVEIFRSNQWGTVCDSNFNAAAAEVVCKLLGFQTHGAEILPGAYFGKGTGLVYFHGVNCTGEERSLDECKTDNSLVCDHDNDVSLRCGPVIRLVNGEFPTEGRLEVFRSNKWGSVCQTDTTADSVAIVVCRALGFSVDGAKKLRTLEFGKSTLPIAISNLWCGEDEDILDRCQYKEPHARFCNQNYDYDLSIRCGTE